MNKNNTQRNKIREKKLKIAVPPGKTEETVPTLLSCENCGDDLAEFGVLKGDSLIIRPTATLDEDRITVWETPDGLMAQFAYDNFGDITLYNKKDWLKRYPAKKVKLIGVVIAIQRNLPAQNA